MGDQNLLDKSMRSVFVGNIPYEATEEKLKDIFNEVGPVLSFKLVFDRETGKPKGYGFCEYKDQETALSAMRNLNGYEIGGRMLRVDNACTEKSRLEMQSLLQGPVVENQYGESVSPEKAPEAISKAVASLPPEQMFELMRQMKLCVQNNPTEARQMLLQNPQLAYALLQAQVVMRIVDPQAAVAMLQKANKNMQPLLTGDSGRPAPVPAPQPRPEYTPAPETHWAPPAAPPPLPPQVPPQIPPHVPQMPAMPPQQFGGSGDLDMRAMDPRMARSMGDQDLRMPPQQYPPPPPPDHFARDPRGGMGERFQRDPRANVPPPGMPPGVPRPVMPPGPVPQPVSAPNLGPRGPLAANIGGAATDQEKAALIMQVLQLSDDQIAMLPPEQRQSILVLKEQIAKSTQR
ncbi:cleavage stimulation factor subunit 2-like [Macrosteles quadrilineatus]|uniref:cleavage stimulation factor subunit 2-like n=1 Tax=Macrosteles quadrilineatus TaxID=74068 RepID=UPI0023E1777C|nr:cleavage stimulation factor subunit 2-like [Macrosteles quadrilineatus]